MGDNILEKFEPQSVSYSSGEIHEALTIPFDPLSRWYIKMTLRGENDVGVWGMEDTSSCQPTSSHGGTKSIETSQCWNQRNGFQGASSTSLLVSFRQNLWFPKITSVFPLKSMFSKNSIPSFFLHCCTCL